MKFLNQARADAWFLEIAFVWEVCVCVYVCVYVCVCVPASQAIRNNSREMKPK